MEIKKYNKFYESTQEYKIGLEINKLKNKIKSFFEKESEDVEDLKLSDIEAELESMNTNDWTTTHQNLTVKFSTPKNHFSMLIKIDLIEVENDDNVEIEEMFIKIKKLDQDFDLIGSVERTINIEDFSSETIMEMIIEIESEFEDDDDEELGMEFE